MQVLASMYLQSCNTHPYKTYVSHAFTRCVESMYTWGPNCINGFKDPGIIYVCMYVCNLTIKLIAPTQTEICGSFSCTVSYMYIAGWSAYRFQVFISTDRPHRFDDDDDDDDVAAVSQIKLI